MYHDNRTIWMCALLVIFTLLLTYDYIIITREVKVFKVYWSVDNSCDSYNIHFNETDWGFITNTNKDGVLILRYPGLQPSQLKGLKLEDITQLFNLTLQKIHLTEEVDKYVHETYQGIAVVHISSWEDMWKFFKPDNCPSTEKKNETVSDNDENNFSSFFKELVEPNQLMQEVIRSVRIHRHRVKWGFQGTPLCFQYIPGLTDGTPNPADVEKLNDELSFNMSDVLIPSFNMKKHNVEEKHKLKHIKFCTSECLRMTRNGNDKSCIPIISPVYKDDADSFLLKEDLESILMITKDAGWPAAIVTDLGYKLNSKNNCERFQEYVKNILGPVVKYMSQTQINSDMRQGK